MKKKLSLLARIPPRMRRTFALCVVLGGLSILVMFAYVTLLRHVIRQRIIQLRATRVSEFYALYPHFRPNQSFRSSDLTALLENQGFRIQPATEELVPYSYSWEKREEVLHLVRPQSQSPGFPLERLSASLIFSSENKRLILKEIIRTDTGEKLEQLEIAPKRIAAFFAGRLRTQNFIPLSDMPVSARLSVMAIEDTKFLEHRGISPRAILRALWRDLRARRWVEGGSTITQQLVKNLFFSQEKALVRKAREALYASLMEIEFSKEDILEAYLNEVYLGQWSTHEIHGIAEGAYYYFNRDPKELTLAQSATLAAMIQAPASHDPHRHPDKLLKRRNLVLKRMLDAEFILEDEYQIAVAKPLGVLSRNQSLDDFDYFLEMALGNLPTSIRTRLDTEPLSIYVSLNPYLQTVASDVLRKQVEALQTKFKHLKSQKEAGRQLQAALMAVDVDNCSVLALQGGISFRQTQFNRILSGFRQPGSLLKPFVVLTALTSPTEPRITAQTVLEDSPFEWKYEGQSWKPKNYDNLFRQSVTVRQALELSLNIPIVRLAEQVGLDPLLSVLAASGIESPLPKVPSLSLGSADLTPIELVNAYTTLARLGSRCRLRPFYKVFDSNEQLLIENPLETTEEALSPQASFVTVQLMKGVLTHGTARSVAYSAIPPNHFAGKTGTTSDAKDAWFVGFSKELLVLVWLGYDEKEKVGLTGSQGALPIWIEFTEKALPLLTGEDFTEPQGVGLYEVDSQSKGLATARCPKPIREYFIRGTEPSSPCTIH